MREVSSSNTIFLLNAAWPFLTNKEKPSKFVPPHLFNKGIRILRLLFPVLEDISEDSREVVGVKSLDVFMNVEAKDSLTTANSVVYFSNMLMKMLPLKELAVSQPSEIAMR